MRPASVLPRPPGLRLTPSLAVVLLAPAAAIPAGVALGTGHGRQALGLAVALLFLVVGLVDWRYSIYGLLLYLPFSGIPIIATYPDTGVAVLAKDLMFVIPAYVGFVARHRRRSRPMIPDRGVAVLLILLAVLVVAQAFNPLLPNRLVGAIGTKVWLFYIPLWVVGYQLVRDHADLGRLLGVMSVAAVLPVLLGLVEAVAIYSGRSAMVYGWYGDAASAATQDFAELNFQGGGSLRRVPSTFSFVAQYFAFTMSMVAVTYAWWRGVLAGTRWSLAGGALWVLAMLAGLLSGARAAFFFVPLMVGLLLLLDRRGAGLPVGRLVAAIMVVPLAVGLFGARLRALFGDIMDLGEEHLRSLFVEGLGQAFRLTAAGLGTGIDTNASRYAFSGSGMSPGVDGVWYESFFVKSLLELGVAGLLLVVLVLGTMTLLGARRHRHLHDPRLRPVSAALLAFLTWNVIFCVKGQYLDIDPTNIYFWLFAGMLAAVPQLDRPDPDSEADRAPR